MRALLRAAVCLFCVLCPALARAETAAPASNGAPEAHPALWHVQGGHGELYLFGSLHLLPPDFAWRDEAVDRAIKRSTVFVFEVPNDEETQARLRHLIADEGTLPKGESLSHLIGPKARVDFDTEIASLHIAPSAIDDRRPWLAGLILAVTQMSQEGASLQSGVDMALMHEARERGLEMRYLETLDDQIRLIVPNDSSLELQEFEAGLADLKNEKNEFQSYLDAWSKGDVGKIDALMNAGFANEPAARKAMLDNRNEAWLRKLEAMLDEDKVFFVTVGAGHLTGRKGVPNLLRHAGYRVDGP